MALTPDNFAQRAGTGGAPDEWEVWTNGERRFNFRSTEPAMEGLPVSADPFAPARAGTGVWFFRNRGDGKSQLCVRFPSGATQILASEP